MAALTLQASIEITGDWAGSPTVGHIWQSIAVTRKFPPQAENPV